MDSIERKRMEEALTAARDELEMRVKERTAELALAEKEMRALSNRLIAVQEDERRAIARELHDQVGQYLTMVKLLLDRAMKSPPDKVASVLSEASKQVTEIIGQVRNLSLDLRPSMLDDLGLVPALVWLSDRVQAQSSLKVKFERNDLEPCPARINTAVFRIVQEALTNVVRHAGASEARVQIWTENSVLFLSVEDNGGGFDVQLLAPGASNGLSGMRERAKLLGGRFSCESAPGKGTRITAELPIPADASGDN